MHQQEKENFSVVHTKELITKNHRACFQLKHTITKNEKVIFTKFEGQQTQYQHIKNRIFTIVNLSVSLATSNMHSTTAEFKIIKPFLVVCSQGNPIRLFKWIGLPLKQDG